MSFPILTPNQCRDARRELGLSQSDVAGAVGINRVYLSDFENGGTNRLTSGQQKKVVEFFLARQEEAREAGEEINLTFGDQDAPSPGKPVIDPLAQHEGVARALLSIRHFSIDPRLGDEQVAALLDRMEANDQRVKGLLTEKVDRRRFEDSWAEPTEENLRAIFGALAENQLIFRQLQGRPIVPIGEPLETENVHDMAGVMSGLLDDPLRNLLAQPGRQSGDADSKAPAQHEGGEA